MSSKWPLVRLLVAAIVLWGLTQAIGTEAIYVALGGVSASALMTGLGLGAVVTVANAVRWRLIASQLGVQLPLLGAIGAYYRSQFLNSVLPVGVLGDVHRAVSHGRALGDIQTSARAVILERVSAQVVLVAATTMLLLSRPTLLGAVWPMVVALIVAGAVIALVLQRRSAGWWGRVSHAVRRDVRLLGNSWPGIVVSSLVMIAALLAMFVVAARTVSDASVGELIPLGAVVLLGSAIPLSVGGWGPREGVAAWAFALAGLGATTGFAVSIAYGVISLFSTLPGVVALIVGPVALSRTPVGVGSK